MMNFDLKANALGLVLKTIGIEPTPEGLLQAFKLDPRTVFGIAEMVQKEAPGFIAWAQKEAPALVQKIEGFDARLTRLEAVAVSNHAMLLALCNHAGIGVRHSIATNQIAPSYAAEVADAALAEAQGRG